MFSIQWFVSLFIFLLSFSSFATNVCLYARSNNGPASGHSFVTVEDGGKIIETYGFWPLEKHPGSLAINFTSDLPLHILLNNKKYKVPDKMLTMTEARTCRPLIGNDIEALRESVNAYILDYGKYQTLSNNCTHFAIRIYNAATGDNFAVVTTPLRARNIMANSSAKGK